MTDPVSDMFIRIKNAQNAGHEFARAPYSKFKFEIAKTLERAGLVASVDRKGKRIRKTLEIALLSREEKPLITNVRMISKPSRRLYISYKDLNPAKLGGVLVLSTPKGVMSSVEARKEKVGGELIAEVW